MLFLTWSLSRTEEEQSEETRDDESGDSIEEKPILKANIELPQ